MIDNQTSNGSETSDSQYSHGSALRMAEASDAEKQSEDSRMALVELVIVNAPAEARRSRSLQPDVGHGG